MKGRKNIRTPSEIKKHNKGIFEVHGTNVAIDNYLQDKLDLVEFKDYVLVTNQTIDGFSVKMLHFVSQKGFARFVQSGFAYAEKNGVVIVRKWSIKSLEQIYSLFKDGNIKREEVLK